MSSVGFEPAIPAIKQLNTYALDGTATWISDEILLGLPNQRWCKTHSYDTKY